MCELPARMPEAYTHEPTGYTFCMEHRREYCHACRVDNRLTNAMCRGEDYEEANERIDRCLEADELAIRARHAAEGRTDPLLWGSDRCVELYDVVAAVPPSGRCSNCDREVPVKPCKRCYRARYCCKECQAEAWPAGHKSECVPAEDPAAAHAAIAAETSWKKLSQAGGAREKIPGAVLELRVMTDPRPLGPVAPVTGSYIYGKDKDGDPRKLAFLCTADKLPAGLTACAVLRWRDPRYGGGPAGMAVHAHVPEADMANVTVA